MQISLCDAERCDNGSVRLLQSSNASSDYSAPYSNTLNAARFNSFHWMGDDVSEQEDQG